MNFNDLLHRDNINPKQAIVVRHAELPKVLAWFAEESPDIFNAYQQSQSIPLETALMGLRNTGYLASFLAYGPAKAICVGLYTVGNSCSINEKQFWNIPANKQLKKHGYIGFVATFGPSSNPFRKPE